jgi:hypothetical protein
MMMIEKESFLNEWFLLTPGVIDEKESIEETSSKLLKGMFVEKEIKTISHDKKATSNVVFYELSSQFSLTDGQGFPFYFFFLM